MAFIIVKKLQIFANHFSGTKKIEKFKKPKHCIYTISSKNMAL